MHEAKECWLHKSQVLFSGASALAPPSTFFLFLAKVSFMYHNMHLLCFMQAFARIENHYFMNKGFFPSDSFLLDNIDKIKHINTVIVQVHVTFSWLYRE